MKKILSILFCCLFLLFSCSSSPVPAEDVQAIAASYIADLKDQNTDALLHNYEYDSQMNQVLSEDMYNSIYSDLSANYGEWLETKSQETSVSKNYRIITYPAVFTNRYLNMNIVFDENKKIAGINYTIRSEALPSSSSAAVSDASSNTTESFMEVSFGKEPYIISGTLTLPAGEGPFPSVVLVHGSGPSDRNETIGGNHPFADIASYLAKNGIAVLRYDKRTYTYAAEMDAESITPYEETVEDAVYAFGYLQTVQSINPGKIFLLGHSLGGLLIPKIAQETPEAAGYIMVSAPSSPLQELMAAQYEYIFNLDGIVSAEEESQLLAVQSQRDKINALTAESTDAASGLLGAGKAYWLYLKEYDPVASASAIQKPLLLLQGERDYQVPMSEFEKYKTALQNNSSATFISYPGLNHLLYAGEGTPGPQEYNTPGEVSTDLLSDLANWINQN